MDEGVQGEDRFGWLRDNEDPRVADWQREQDARTVAALAASPARQAVEQAVRATFVDLFTSTAPEPYGPRWFRSTLPAGHTKIVLEVRDDPAGPGRVIVDPALDGPNATIARTSVAFDGSMVLVAIDVGGVVDTRIVDAEGKLLYRYPELTMPSMTAWAPDLSGFYHQRLVLGTDEAGRPAPAMRVSFQPLVGESQPIELEVDHPFARVATSADSEWVALVASQVSPRPRWIKRFGDSDWIRFLPDATAMYKGRFVGDEYWAITDDTSGWCRLVAIPIATQGDEATWRELLPARDGIKLASISLCGDHIALATFDDGIMRLEALDRDGVLLGQVPLPGDGAFGQFGMGHILTNFGDVVVPDGDGCIFVHSSLGRGPGVYRADLAARTLTTIEEPAVVLADRDIRRFTAEGPHGPVHYWLMRKRSTPLDGSAAAIASGYGGFNVPHLSHYWPMAAAWTELGGIWIVAQLRGGGERDTAFWEAGRMRRKQGTFDDFAAVIEDMQARGFASPGRTGIWGTSNGGLLVGATVTQRPDLVRAGVAQVPALDLKDMAGDPVSASICKADYGDAEDEGDMAAMLAYSPLQNVRAGTAYPALLCDAGADDHICAPWQSRKMIAAVSEASSSGHRMLLRVREGTGHNQMTYAQFVEREIEEVTFFHDELQPGG